MAFFQDRYQEDYPLPKREGKWGSFLVTADITVGTSHVALPTSNLTNRDGIILQNKSASNKLFIKDAINVSSTDGFQLDAGESIDLPIGDETVLYGEADGAGTNVCVLEYIYATGLSA